MKNLWMVFIVLVGLFISPPAYAFLPFPDGGQTSGESSGLKSVKDDLLQFTSGGHVLGFGSNAVHVAGLDRVLRVEHVGGRPVQPVAEGAGTSSDNPASLGRVTYDKAWDGVDVVYRAAENGILESFYYLEDAEETPGIRLRYNRPVSLDGQGNLVTAFENGNMVESAPIAWQEVNGEKRFVDATYVLHGEQEVGFALNDCLPGVPVVIDPVLTWNTFLGSNNSDYGRGIVVDGVGNVYVVGTSYASWGSPKLSYKGLSDAFVAKLDGNTGALVWNSFKGGKGNDSGNGIALDNKGYVYVTGTSDVAWPSSARAFCPGGTEAFVSRLRNSDGFFDWDTFLGGPGDDTGMGLALDDHGDVYVIGTSDASWSNPVPHYGTVRPHQGGIDTFAAKLNGPDGTLRWNTFLGGSGKDYGRSITVEEIHSNVYVVGFSSASWGSQVPRVQSGGVYDAFVAKLDNQGNLAWNTFLGSSSGTSSAFSITHENRRRGWE